MFTAIVIMLAVALLVLFGGCVLIRFKILKILSDVPSPKPSVWEFIKSVRENCLQGQFFPKPSVSEFINGIRKNGFKSELDYLKSIKGKEDYAKIVSLAFHYEREDAIYN